MEYRISLKAQEDLISIWEFTFENWSVEQADRYYELIIDKIKQLCQKPDIGKKYDVVREGYWGVHVKSHIIFYRIREQETIEIIRVLHNRMDVENRLSE
ncbi:MAG: type II toxin-antitoxin system RelE/ParE family toxin [Cyclobacteriaceae bacterium]|nr:type II toxin-antitoxin system RelE/ParE family toxin [Cyclobacteriaceae bacterium]